LGGEMLPGLENAEDRKGKGENWTLPGQKAPRTRIKDRWNN